MSKVKVYDVRSCVEKNSNGKYTTFYEHEYAVIEGPKGLVITGSEGVHYFYNAIGDTHQFALEKKREGSVAFMAEATIDVTLKEITELPYREVELGEFIRRFGSRLEQNYGILLDSLEGLGLDPKDYPRETKEKVNA